jgi:hypothetical protein
MADEEPGEAMERVTDVTVFAIPTANAESTLKAVMAMNEAGGGDLFMLKGETAAAGTLTGTACEGTGHPSHDFNCTDKDA